MRLVVNEKSHRPAGHDSANAVPVRPMASRRRFSTPPWARQIMAGASVSNAVMFYEEQVRKLPIRDPQHGLLRMKESVRSGPVTLL
jgi:hypothetical protein